MDEIPNNEELDVEVILEITAEMAARWLESNTHNRKLRDRYIQRLALLMLRGEWRLNGDAIRFDVNNVILDGQHRLWALVLAAKEKPDVTIPSLVIRNLPPEAQETMDTGIRRSLADTLELRGETNCVQLSSTLNRIHLTELGEGALRNPNVHRLTSAQAVAMLERNPGIRDVVKVALRFRKLIPVSVPVMATCLWQFEHLDHEDSIAFWNAVAVPEKLGRYDPRFVLHQSLNTMAKSTRKPSSVFVHAIIIKAWNAFRQGRDIQLLSFKQGGKTPDKFPEPV